MSNVPFPGMDWDEAGGYRSGGRNPLRSASDIAMGGGGPQKSQWREPYSAQPRPQANPNQGIFKDSGIGKYVNGRQFNKPAITGAIGKGLDMYATARYFRHAGFAQALRHTLGLQPVPSHMNDWIRQQHKFTEVGLPGLNPHDVHGQEHW